jgi:puromycin-sensitive aminopeptidase
MDPKAYRLPEYAVPRQYDIYLDASRDSEEFRGSVAIRLDIREPRESIELHARDLRLSDALLSAGGARLDGEIALDDDREVVTVRFARALPVGEATLSITFEGRVGNGLRGLYVAKDGPEELLCTLCFPTEARSLFPCFDEPAFKARFSYRVTTSPDAVVLANSPLVSVEESEGGKKTWSFAATRPMSTYLAALAIGDLASTEQEIVRGTPMRVWALKGKEQMGRFAHDYATRLLPWYEEYFGLPYHFDKYDQVAVPGFAAGAMENSGLVTFRQIALLMDPRTASWEQEKRIAHVVAHEFAHMWFGNLATVKWWDDVWLSEAFAEWLSHKVVNALTPDYAIWDDFQRQKNIALETDALESTHPIYTPVSTPAEAIELFDAITYLKGCSVLRMLESYLGEEVFRAGLRAYMREFSESNATSADLWRHLQSASDEPVTRMMESWITQGGYPVLEVGPDSSGIGTWLRIAQGRFHSNPEAPKATEATWHVPVIVRYEDREGIHELRYLLSEREASISLGTSEVSWCYANAGEKGFYRQNLSRELLDRLLANPGKLSPAEQMGLLSDQWALVRGGTHGISQFLDVLSAFLGSGHYGVVEKVVGHLHTLDDLLEDAGDEVVVAKFRDRVSEAFSQKLAGLGFEPRAGESRNDSQQRIYLIDAMCAIARDEEAVSQAKEWAGREASDPASVDKDLAEVFVSAAAQSGDVDLFEKYVEIYRARRDAGASPQETNRYLQSFPVFRSSALVERTLGLMDDGIIPQESLVPGLQQMLRRKHSQLQAWDYLKVRWEHLQASVGIQVDGLVEATGRLPASRREDLVGFFSEHLNGTSQMSYARALETLDQLAEFKARTKDELVGWFNR